MAHALKTTLWRQTAIDLSSRPPYDINNNSITQTHGDTRTHVPFQRGIDHVSAVDHQLIPLWGPIHPSSCACAHAEAFSSCDHDPIRAQTTYYMSLIHTNSYQLREISCCWLRDTIQAVWLYWIYSVNCWAHIGSALSNRPTAYDCLHL